MTVLTPDDSAYAAEVAGFNLAAVTTPELVVGATSTNDVVDAVRLARTKNLALHVQATGHGGPHAIHSGVLVSTRRLDSVRIDPQRALATIGGGARWSAVIAAAAEHGL